MTRQKPTLPHSSLLHILELDQTKKIDARLRRNDDEKDGYNNGKPTTPSPSMQPTGALKDFEIRCQKIFGTVRTQEEFTTRISDILERLGFTTFTFAALSHKPCLLFTSLTDAFRQDYQEEHFTNDDYDFRYRWTNPVFRSAIKNYMRAAPVETCDMARNLEISDLHKKHGYYDSYLIPVSADGNRFLFCVTTQTKNIRNFHVNITAHAQELALLGELILRWGMLKFKEAFDKAANPPQICITSKQLTVIKILAQDDLTLLQTADKLCISIHTADKHSAAAKKALKANTIHGAVYKAIKEDLIK